MKISQLRNVNKDILIMGDIFLDIFQTTDIVKMSPERPVPVLEPTMYCPTSKGLTVCSWSNLEVALSGEGSTVAGSTRR